MNKKIFFSKKRNKLKIHAKGNTAGKIKIKPVSNIPAPTMLGATHSDEKKLIKKFKLNHKSGNNDFSLSKGENISADFEGKVVKLLGVGGFGKVYLVESKIQIGENDYYKSYSAVKVINADLDKRSADQAVNDLLKEAAVTSSFGGYTYVVNARLLTKNNQVIGAIYDFVDGPNLADFLDKHIEKGLLPPVEIALSIGERILRVLEMSQNEYHLAHKDIALANCMLHGKSGTPRVIDWGGAHSSSDNSPIGKAPYMAPELLKWFLYYSSDKHPLLKGLVTEKTITGTPPLCFETYCKSDIFSFGILMYELIGGFIPFDLEAGDSAKILKHRFENFSSEQTIPRLNFICDDVYKELSDIIHQCLSYDIEKRPTPSELLQKFNYLLFGNGQMGFGTTDRTHAKYWQAFEIDRDYDFDSELEKLLKSKLRKDCALQFGQNARIDEHYDIKEEVESMYRTFEEAFGLEYCHQCLVYELKIAYSRAREKTLLYSTQEEREKIIQQYDSYNQYVENAEYEEIEQLFMQDSEILFLEDMLNVQFPDKVVSAEEKEEIFEEFRKEIPYSAEMEKFNNQRKFFILKYNLLSSENEE